MAFSTGKLAILAIAMCICFIIQEADAAYEDGVEVIFANSDGIYDHTAHGDKVVENGNRIVYEPEYTNCKKSMAGFFTESETIDSKKIASFIEIKKQNSVIQRYRKNVLCDKKIWHLDPLWWEEWCDKVQSMCMENIRLNGFIYGRYIGGDLWEAIKADYEALKKKSKKNIVREFIQTGQNIQPKRVIELVEYSYLVGKKINFAVAEKLRSKEEFVEEHEYIKLYRDYLLNFKDSNPNMSENQLYDSVKDVEDFCVNKCLVDLREYKYTDASLKSSDTYIYSADNEKKKKLAETDPSIDPDENNYAGAPCCVVMFSELKRSGEVFQEKTLEIWCMRHCI